MKEANAYPEPMTTYSLALNEIERVDQLLQALTECRVQSPSDIGWQRYMVLKWLRDTESECG